MSENINSQSIPNCVTKKELQKAYRVTHDTLRLMLNRIPQVAHSRRKILFPIDLQAIYKIYGNPFVNA